MISATRIIRAAGVALALTVSSVALQAQQMDAMDKKDMGRKDMGKKPMKKMNMAQMNKMMNGWPKASKDAVMFMTDKYGAPMHMTEHMAMWGQTGQWKRTIVYNHEVKHDFPMPHTDVMQQFIDYKVPLDKYDDLAMYDGSVVVERTNGEISARCDKEAANFLALNLAHEIATGARTAEDGRRMYAEQIMAKLAMKPAPYTEKLMWTPMMGGSMDADRPATK
jgi:hypothetical protein